MADEHEPRPDADDAPDADEPQPAEEQPGDAAQDAAQEGDVEHAAEQEAQQAAAESAAPEEKEENEFGTDQKRMSFGDHLIELRNRILICIATVLVAFVIFFVAFNKPLYKLLIRPCEVAARNVAADLAEKTGEEAGQRAAELVAEAAAGPLDFAAIADAVQDDVDGVDHRAIVRALEEIKAASGAGKLDPKAVEEAVATTVARSARGAVDPKRFLIARNPTSMFVTTAYFSLLAAIALTIPVTGYQMWGFVAPGLRKKERRFVVPILTVGTVLFLGGAAFAYLTVVPISLHFLMGYTVQYDGVRVMWDVRDTVKFEAILILVFGLAFEMPLVITALTRVGLIKPETIAKHRRHAIVAMFIIGALLTPPDVVTQCLLAGPLIILLEISIQTAKFFRPKHTIWEPWDEKDYTEAWETSIVPESTDLGSDRPAESDAQAKPSTPADADKTPEETPDDVPQDADEDYSYEQESGEDETDPYAYGEDAYQPEDWEGEGEEDPLERLRKDLRRRRTSRRIKRPGPRRGRGRRGRPNV